MADQHTIRSFTAIDIEKYHKGQLSARDMHDLEKAALDDPFLADALEGFAVPAVNAAQDIAGLKKRLAEKTGQTKVIPLAKTKRRTYWWLRIAAMIIVVAGAGFLVYQIGFNNNKSNTVAKSEAAKKQAPSTEASASDNTNTLARAKETDLSTAEEQSPIDKTKDPSVTEEKDLKNDAIAIQGNSQATISPSNNYKSAPLQEENVTNKEGEDVNSLRTYQLDSITPGIGVARSVERDRLKDKDGINDDLEKKVAANSNSRHQGALAQPTAQLPRNIFRGRITDRNYNPLPFANVTNISDNVGTYANAKGYFTLTSTDSVLNVQIRSVGFDNKSILLKSDTLANTIVMAEDNNSLEAVVIDNNRNLNSSRQRSNTMVLEEPEPVDGWHNYDTYIANNLNIPESYKTKQPSAGEVVVSFEVGSNGEPINLKIEKSLCESCDIEAMRLVKEGPKFRHKAKRRGRTKVAVSF